MANYFLDTNALLQYGDRLNELNGFIISSISLIELEKIKSSSSKDEEIKYKARVVSRFLDKNDDKYEVVVVHSNHYNILDSMDLPLTNDNLIVACAHSIATLDDLTFISYDLNCRTVAKKLFGLQIGDLEYKQEEKYTGYKEITVSESDMAYFYSNIQENMWGLLTNQYVIIKNTQDEIVDKLKWNGSEHVGVRSKLLKSMAFGSIRPKDIYQEMAIDSLLYDDFTIIQGVAGTGKTLISLAFVLQQLQNNKISNCTIVNSPLPLFGVKSLGYYPGDRTSKLLEGSIGGILSSKLGDPMMVETMIAQGKLTLIPACDIRGYEVSDNSCLYVTEAQNMDTYLTKTVIQRCKEGCKIILEGDSRQSDLRLNGQNGLERVVDVFKGDSKFSCVELQNIYRSHFSELAEKL